MQDTTEHCIADSTVEGSLSLEHIEEKVHVNQAALFILTAKECLKVSQMSLNTMLDDIDALVSVKLHEAEHKVLSHNLVSEEIVGKTRDIFNTEESLFSGLHTTYSQNKYFVNHLGLVVRHACKINLNL